MDWSAAVGGRLKMNGVGRCPLSVNSRAINQGDHKLPRHVNIESGYEQWRVNCDCASWQAGVVFVVVFKVRYRILFFSVPRLLDNSNQRQSNRIEYVKRVALNSLEHQAAAVMVMVVVVVVVVLVVVVLVVVVVVLGRTSSPSNVVCKANVKLGWVVEPVVPCCPQGIGEVVWFPSVSLFCRACLSECYVWREDFAGRAS